MEMSMSLMEGNTGLRGQAARARRGQQFFLVTDFPPQPRISQGRLIHPHSTRQTLWYGYHSLVISLIFSHL